MNNILGLNSAPRKQVYFPILGSIESQDPYESIRAISNEISIGVPWAYKKFIRKFFFLFFSLLEKILRNLLVMLIAMALVQKKNPMKV